MDIKQTEHRLTGVTNAAVGLVATVVFGCVALGGVLYYVIDKLRTVDTGVLVVLALALVGGIVLAVIGVSAVNLIVTRKGMDTVVRPLAEQSAATQAMVSMAMESQARLISYILGRMEVQQTPQIDAPAEAQLEPPRFVRTGDAQWQRQDDTMQARAERLAAQMVIRMYPHTEPTDANIERLIGESSGSAIALAWQCLVSKGRGVPGKSGQKRQWVVTSPTEGG